MQDLITAADHPARRLYAAGERWEGPLPTRPDALNDAHGNHRGLGEGTDLASGYREDESPYRDEMDG